MIVVRNLIPNSNSPLTHFLYFLFLPRIYCHVLQQVTAGMCYLFIIFLINKIAQRMTFTRPVLRQPSTHFCKWSMANVTRPMLCLKKKIFYLNSGMRLICDFQFAYFIIFIVENSWCSRECRDMFIKFCRLLLILNNCRNVLSYGS